MTDKRFSVTSPLRRPLSPQSGGARTAPVNHTNHRYCTELTEWLPSHGFHYWRELNHCSDNKHANLKWILIAFEHNRVCGNRFIFWLIVHHYTSVVFDILRMFTHRNTYSMFPYSSSCFAIYKHIYSRRFTVEAFAGDCHVCCCLMITLLCRSMADSAVGRSFRLVVDRVNTAAASRPPVCLFLWIYAVVEVKGRQGAEPLPWFLASP